MSSRRTDLSGSGTPRTQTVRSEAVRAETARTELIYGVHAVRALLTRSPQRVRRVLLQWGRQDARAQQIERLARAAGCAVERVDAERLAQHLGDAVHQGVVAEVQPLAAWDEDALLAAVVAAMAPASASPAGSAVTSATTTPAAVAATTIAPAAGAPLLLALDGVQDPHNLGACLRTADACGVLALVMPRDRAAPLNATARKVAAGAAESTPVAIVTNLARTLRLLKEAGLWIVGAEAEAEREVREVDLTGGRVLVVGAEGTGLRQLTRRHCDWLVRLPSLGAVESLNVSVACGMLLYETLRQRRPGGTAAGGAAGGGTATGGTAGGTAGG